MKTIDTSFAAIIRASHRQLAWPVLASALAMLAYFALNNFVGDLASFPGSRAFARNADLILVIFGVIAGTWLVSRFAQLIVTSVMLSRGKRPSRLLLQLITIVLSAVAGVTALSWTVDGAVTGALATSGIVVAIIGFALRNIIADVFSGIALSVESPYRIGDWIETDTGIAGRVVEINWRATRIETRNQVHIVVPNGRMAMGRLTNYSSPRPYFRTQIPVTVDFDVPVARAKRILLAAVTATRNIRPTPAPDVKVDGYGDHGVKYVIRYWLSSFTDDVDCRDAVLANIDRHLRLAGLTVPYRRRVLLERPRRAIHDGVTALSRLPGFEALSIEASDQFAAALSQRSLAAGDILLDGEDPDDHVHILVEGLLELRDDRDRRLATLEPGTVVGQPARLARPVSARGFHVIAATDCLVFSAATGRLKTSVLENSDLGAVLRAGVGRWLSLLDDHRADDARSDASVLQERPVRSSSALVRLRDWMK